MLVRKNFETIYIYIYIYIYISSSSLSLDFAVSLSPYHPSMLAGFSNFIQYPQWADGDKLFVVHQYLHMWKSKEERYLWFRPCFSRCASHVCFVLFGWWYTSFNGNPSSKIISCYTLTNDEKKILTIYNDLTSLVSLSLYIYLSFTLSLSLSLSLSLAIYHYGSWLQTYHWDYIWCHLRQGERTFLILD